MISRRIPALPHLTAMLLLVSACSKDAPTKPRTPATPSVPAGTIAFVGSHDWQLYTVHTDGTALHKLTALGAVGHLHWSPNGAKIAFSGPGGVWLMNADGTGQTNPSNGASPVWSPDGAKVLFFATNGTIYTDVYSVNADGTGVTNLTQNPGLAGSYDPAWSPDGTQIVFMTVTAAVPPAPATFALQVMNANGTNRHTIATGRKALPSWSPDGTRILYQRNPGSDINTFMLYAAHLDGTGEQAVYPYLVVPQQARWSPDGKVVFESSISPQGVTGDTHTYVARPDGTGVQRLTTQVLGARRPSWSTDEMYLAAETGEEIRVLKSDGSSIAKIPNTFQGTEAAWKP